MMPEISIHALLAESDTSVVSSAGTTGISIHALLAESDCLSICRWAPAFYFYPRSPCGERPVNIQRPTAKNDFYPRSPCGERQ